MIGYFLVYHNKDSQESMCYALHLDGENNGFEISNKELLKRASSILADNRHLIDESDSLENYSIKIVNFSTNEIYTKHIKKEFNLYGGNI